MTILIRIASKDVTPREQAPRDEEDVAEAECWGHDYLVT